MQTPVHADYASRLEAMLVDVTRERIDFRRPSWVIVRVGSEMGKIFGAVIDVHNKKTSCRGTKKEAEETVFSILARFGVWHWQKRGGQCQKSSDNNQPKGNPGNYRPSVSKDKPSYFVT